MTPLTDLTLFAAQQAQEHINYIEENWLANDGGLTFAAGDEISNINGCLREILRLLIDRPPETEFIKQLRLLAYASEIDECNFIAEAILKNFYAN